MRLDIGPATATLQVIDVVRRRLFEETEAWLRMHAEHMADVRQQRPDTPIEWGGFTSSDLLAMVCMRCKEEFRFTLTAGKA